MGSVSPVNPGVADLLQTLTDLNSPVMSSPAAVSALEKAPPSDIVQLSDSAAQLEGVDELFGVLNGSNSGAGSLLAALVENLANSAGVASTPVGSQAVENQGLLGSGSSSGLSGSLLDATG
jgi:hypothetical protein